VAKVVPVADSLKHLFERRVANSSHPPEVLRTADFG